MQGWRDTNECFSFLHLAEIGNWLPVSGFRSSLKMPARCVHWYDWCWLCVSFGLVAFRNQSSELYTLPDDQQWHARSNDFNSVQQQDNRAQVSGKEILLSNLAVNLHSLRPCRSLPYGKWLVDCQPPQSYEVAKCLIGLPGLWYWRHNQRNSIGKASEQYCRLFGLV